MAIRKSILSAISLIVILSLPCLAADEDLKPVRHDFPPVGTYQVITGDFHMHTVNSDGKLTTRERVEESYKWGYDAIAVTDHGKMVSYTVARGIGERLGMVVIRGFETGIAKNEHMVVLNVPCDYKIRDAHNWAEKPGEPKAFYQDELNKIAKVGGVVIYPHPHVGYREPVLWGVKQGIIQGIELKNGVVGAGWNTVESHGTHWYPAAMDFALEHNLTIFANSDVHGIRKSDTSPVTLLLVTERSACGVMDAIKQRRTAAWFADMLWGREKLLKDLITSSVSFDRTADGSIEIENRCPVSFSLAISDQKLELPAYGKASAKAGSAKSIEVQWNNVWTGLKTNLRTEVALRTL